MVVPAPCEAILCPALGSSREERYEVLEAGPAEGDKDEGPGASLRDLRLFSLGKRLLREGTPSLCVNILGRDQRMDPGSALKGPAVGQEEQAGTDAQQGPPCRCGRTLCVTKHWKILAREAGESPHTPTLSTGLKGEPYNCDMSPPALSALSPMSYPLFSPPACPKS